MGVRFYDEALAEKLSKWVKDPNIRILKPDETSRLFQMTADLKNDKKLTLPIIALSRDRVITVKNTKKRFISSEGLTIDSSDTKSMQVCVVPIRISYQLDIYTRGMTELDEYTRNFVFNLINFPNLHITIPYNGTNLEFNSTIYMDTDITDNSNIQEKLFADQFQRQTIKLTIEDAYYWSVPLLDNIYIDSEGEFIVQDRISHKVEEQEIITLSENKN